MKKSKRGMVDPFIVMDVMEEARKAEVSGKKVIHMEVGQPWKIMRQKLHKNI